MCDNTDEVFIIPSSFQVRDDAPGGLRGCRPGEGGECEGGEGGIEEGEGLKNG